MLTEAGQDSAYIPLVSCLPSGIKNNSQDLQKLLNAYLEANGKINEIEKKYVGEYTKVIPEEKVAKLYVAEERFRREQINRLKGPWGMGDRPQDKVSQ